MYTALPDAASPTLHGSYTTTTFLKNPHRTVHTWAHQLPCPVLPIQKAMEFSTSPSQKSRMQVPNKVVLVACMGSSPPAPGVFAQVRGKPELRRSLIGAGLGSMSTHTHVCTRYHAASVAKKKKKKFLFYFYFYFLLPPFAFVFLPLLLFVLLVLGAHSGNIASAEA